MQFVSKCNKKYNMKHQQQLVRSLCVGVCLALRVSASVGVSVWRRRRNREKAALFLSGEIISPPFN